MSRKWWVAVAVLGVVLIPIGVVWMAYAITQTDGSTTNTSDGSWWTIAAFFVAFIGGTLVTIGSVGFVFRWMSGDGDDNEFYMSPSQTVANAVPKTRVGWGGDTPEG
jgi:hypothetical protein